MSCAAVQNRLSAYRDGELPATEAGAVSRHLAACSTCGARWTTLRDALDALATLPRLEAREPIAVGVFDRLDMEARRPSLATLFRPFGASRPLILPSLAWAIVVLVGILGAVVHLDEAPEPLPAVAAAARPADWIAPDSTWGSESNPAFPAAGVSSPRSHGGVITPAVLERAGEGTIFLETVVARDGTVSAVTLLDGDSEYARTVVDALRQKRFEPGRFRGRPVAVSLYMLIAHTEVIAPIT